MKALFKELLLCTLFLGCSQEYQTATITIEDYRFTPQQIHLQNEMPLRLIIRNQGREIHQFTSTLLRGRQPTVKGKISSAPANVQTPITISPGKSLEFILEVSEGIYPFRCPIRGHGGMHGQIVVVSAGRE